MIHETSDHDHDVPFEHPVASAQVADIVFEPSVSEPLLREETDAFLCRITGSLKRGGCTLIGHIKGVLEQGQEGRLFFSVTSFEGAPRYKGAIKGPISKVRLTINIIVYGVGETHVYDALDKALKGGYGSSYSICTPSSRPVEPFFSTLEKGK